MKLAVYLSLPFTGNHCLQIQTQLLKLFSFAYPQINPSSVFHPVRCLPNFFSIKDHLPIGMRSHVVYLFKCQSCDALYVGETCRHIYTRISDLMGISTLTGKKFGNPPFQGILSHHRETGHSISFKITVFFLSVPPALSYSFVKAF